MEYIHNILNNCPSRPENKSNTTRKSCFIGDDVLSLVPIYDNVKMKETEQEDWSIHTPVAR